MKGKSLGQVRACLATETETKIAAAHLQLRKVEETAPAVLHDVARCCRMLHVMVCFGSTCIFTFVWLDAGQNATSKEIVFNPFLPFLLTFKFSQWANCAETNRAPKASHYGAASRHGCCGMGSKLLSGPGFLKLVHIVFLMLFTYCFLPDVLFWWLLNIILMCSHGFVGGWW